MSGVRILPLVILVGLMVLSMRVVNLFSGSTDVAVAPEPAAVSMVQAARAQAPATDPAAAEPVGAPWGARS